MLRQAYALLGGLMVMVAGPPAGAQDPPPPESAPAPVPAPAPMPPPPPPPPPPPGVELVRAGWTYGIGLGVGTLIADCDECESNFEAGGLHGHLGWMVSPRLAIELDVWAMVHSDVFLTVFQNLNTIAARYWVTPALWLKLGVGNANAGYRWDGPFAEFEDRTKGAPGFLAGAGYEVLRRGTFILDLQLRYGTGLYGQQVGDDYVVEGHSVSLGAAANWY